MGTVVLIGTVAIIVAIVGCFFIWRLDASRAEEVQQTAPLRTTPGRETRSVTTTSPQPKHLHP